MREVVGVAILRGGRVLAVRRAHPPSRVGDWELPGGKVEPDEDPGTTAVREVAEELGCTIAVTGWLAGSSPVGESLVLRIAVAELRDGFPVPREHDAVRWLAADQLDEVRWGAADVPFLPAVRELLVAG